MIRRVVVALFVTLGLMAAPMVASAAPGDYPAPAAISVLGVSGSCDGVEGIAVSGEGYTASETVEVVVQAAHKVSTQVDADADGKFSVTMCPADVGEVTVTATGMTSGVVQQTTMTVKATSDETVLITDETVVIPAEAGGAGNAGAMPNTGVNRSGLILGAAGGALALIIGAGLLWLGATRRKPGGQAAL